MIRPTLQGHSILVIEDELLVAMDIALAFEKAGAHVEIVTTAEEALVMTDDVTLTAAIVDHGLVAADSGNFYQNLQECGIPFMIYSGFSKPVGIDAPHIAKPSTHEALVQSLVDLLWGSRNTSRDTMPPTTPQPVGQGQDAPQRPEQ